MARYQATVAGLVLLALINVTMSMTVQEFFPDAKSNLTKITWAHKVNSQALLKETLASTDVMMIEADVIMGYKNEPSANKTTTLIPVMAHPPENSSDLTLEEFVNQVLTHNKTGFKLDFKSLDAAKQGIAIVQKHQNITVPVWLNADILKGPVNAIGNKSEPAPLDAKSFLAEAAKLPQALLSIGWTTRLEDPAQNVTGKYTSQQIEEMVKQVLESKTNQSVTYPVRALFAANDGEVLKSLLEKTKANKPTLTVWSSEGDKVDAGKLSQVIKSIGVDKVFVDVPAALRKQLDLSSSAFTAKGSIAVLLASMIVALHAAKLL